MRFNWQYLSANGFWDKTGTTISWLCAVHCLILPFAITFLPLSGLSFLVDEKVEWLIISLSVLIALVSLLPAYLQHHGKSRSLILFTFGIGSIIVSHLFFEDSAVWKMLFIVCGAVSISAAHLLNHRSCRQCQRIEANL